MSFTKDLVHHPRRLRLRRAAFQIHLWGGLALAFYLIVISLSGSVLVFKDELVRASLRNVNGPETGAAEPGPVEAVRLFEKAHPNAHLDLLQVPSPVFPAFLFEGSDSEGKAARWLLPGSGTAIQAWPPDWIDRVHDLHDYLLLPRAWGIQANAAGAAVLLLLCGTGIMLWWPGVKLWTRGLRVRLSGGWRRTNYDLHSAIGFWTLSLVVWWAISGMYFGWYRQVTAAVGRLSPVVGMRSPQGAQLPAPRGAHATLAMVLATGQAASPHGRLWSVSNPQLQQKECYLLFDLEKPGDFSHRDIVRVRAADGQLISVWHYGEKHTLGDWFLWSMHPLHFGTLWGTATKVLWAFLGVTLAALTITGVLMYWNRFLRRQFR